MPKKRHLYSCASCGKVTSTTNDQVLKLEICKRCRRSLI